MHLGILDVDPFPGWGPYCWLYFAGPPAVYAVLVNTDTGTPRPDFVEHWQVWRAIVEARHVAEWDASG